MGFTAMEEARELMIEVFLLSIQDFRNEMKDSRCDIFFVDHVKTCNQVRVFSSFHNSVYHFYYVRFADNFQACSDQAEMEMLRINVILSPNFV